MRQLSASPLRPTQLGWVRLWVGLVLLGRLHGQTLQITGIELDTTGRPQVTHTAQSNSYYVLQRGSALSDLVHPRDVRLGTGLDGQLIDPEPPSGVALYRVWQIPLDAPEDLDRDGLDDVYELQRAPWLNSLDAADADADADGDLRSNLAEVRAGTDPLVADLFVTTSPVHWETGVSVNRETVFRFTVSLRQGCAAGRTGNFSAGAGPAAGVSG